MKVTVNEVIGIHAILRGVGKQSNSIDAMAKIATYIIALRPYIDAYQEKRNELIERYAKIVDDKVEFESDENKAEYEKENKVFLEEELELEIDPIPHRHLSGASIEFDLVVELIRIGVVVD